MLTEVGKHLDQECFCENCEEHPSFQLGNSRYHSHSKAPEMQSQKNLALVEKLQTQLNEVYGSVCASEHFTAHPD